MSSLEAKPSLVRARPLAQYSNATQASQKGTNLLSPAKSTSDKLDSQTSDTTRCDDSGLALTSGPSISNRGPWGLPSPLERTRPFGLGDTVAAEAYQKSLLNVPEETRNGRRSRSHTASSHIFQPSGAGSTRHRGVSHRSSSASASQSSLSPTNHSGAGRSVSTSNSVDRKGNSRERNYEAGDYSSTLAGMVKGCCKRDPDASHDAGRLVLEYLRR
jgi:hypothetical protein